MIFVSSSCVKAQTIRESVTKLNEWGFYNIELSGGTNYYDELENDLVVLKDQGNTFRCHNYFPPPKDNFIINLASLDNDCFERSLTHLINSIELSKKLDCKKFGFHAGFLFDIPIYEIGKSIAKKDLFNKEKAYNQFAKGYEVLKKEAGTLEVYIENNVLSNENYTSFKNENPFLLTNSASFLEMNRRIDFELLLDLAHLKVSATTLGLSFKEELEKLLPNSNYLHISDNDGLVDSNNALTEDSELYGLLKNYDLKGKDITLEIYQEDELKSSYQSLITLEI